MIWLQSLTLPLAGCVNLASDLSLSFRLLSCEIGLSIASPTCEEEGAGAQEVLGQALPARPAPALTFRNSRLMYGRPQVRSSISRGLSVVSSCRGTMEPRPARTAVVHSSFCSSRNRRLRMAAA